MTLKQITTCGHQLESQTLSGQISVVPMERIERAIILVRGQKVMLDRDLAGLYGVETTALNRAVKRNQSRFPAISCFS